MKQVLTIKKTAIDQDLKVTVTLEFTANNPDAQTNLFELIRLQGLPAIVEVTPEDLQPDLFSEHPEKDEQLRHDYEKEPPLKA